MPSEQIREIRVIGFKSALGLAVPERPDPDVRRGGPITVGPSQRALGAVDGAERLRRSASLLLDRAPSQALGATPRLVGGGAVDRWHRHVHEAEIDRQLSAMVDEVIDGRTNGLAARRREQYLVAHLE